MQTTRLDSSRLRVELKARLDSTRLARNLLIRLAFLIRLESSRVEIESILLDSTSSRLDSTFDLSRLDFRLELTRPDDKLFRRFGLFFGFFLIVMENLCQFSSKTPAVTWDPNVFQDIWEVEFLTF